MTAITKRIRHWALCGAAAGALAFSAGGVQAASAAPQDFDLKAQSLDAALHAVAIATGRAILAPSQLLAGKQAPPLKGHYTPDQAFKALLVGSGLEVSLVGDTVIIKDPPGPGEASAAKDGTSTDVVVVTGSHIRGAQPAAPVRNIDRDDIEKSGYAEVGDVIRSLPESYAGGQNPGVQTGAGATNEANQNTTNASSVNLRGLGSDATLVLVDGHRLVPDGLFEAPDISAIPLAAVQRIEVVTDGASALYGSDAVAGVVNFILRKSYDGAEFSQRIGGATEGGGFEQTYGVLGGKSWDGGHVLASLEYDRQEAITVAQRRFTSTAAPIDDLLQPQDRFSAFVNLSQDLTPWATFHLDALYSQRQTGSPFEETVNDPFYDTLTTVRTYWVTPSLTLTLPAGWTAEIDGSAAQSHDHQAVLYAGGAYFVDYRNTSNSLEANASGSLLNLPGGALKIALGAGYRHEVFSDIDTLPTHDVGARDIGYIYGEADAPLVSPSDSRLGLHALELSLAGRYEHYSDFGGTTNPKVGLRYAPVDGVTLRATWGTAFKAPQFIQTVSDRNIFLYSAADLGSSQSGTALLNYGGNPNLKPERSSSWTAGIDWSPPRLPSLKASLTYFHIDYTGRIVQPINALGVALSSPLYAPFVTPDPPAAQQALAIATARAFYNYSPGAYDPSQVVALVEDHYLNAAAQKIDGVDLSVRKSFLLAQGGLNLFGTASWLRITQRTLPTLPAVPLTGTLFNPPKLRVRSGLTWTFDSLAATGVINYIDGETDNGVTPSVPVASWTTVDFNLSYKLPKITPVLSGAEASLSITNAFDQAPPFARGASVQFPGVNFDSTNASAIGRYVALTLKERF